jgi:hypothetical protein
MVEWAREKKKPDPIGRQQSATSMGMVVSMQEMWSASKACRKPRNQAVTATPDPTRPDPETASPPTPRQPKCYGIMAAT